MKLGDYTLGIKELDNALGGIRKGSNIMLVGPSMGQKEIILYNIMYHSAVINENAVIKEGEENNKNREKRKIEKMVEGYNMVDNWITLIVYLVYGTSFILMFLLITMWRKRVANIKLMEGFRYLAVFGLIHGLAEYFAIPRILGWQNAWIFDIVKLILISSSFTALLIFGLNIITVGVEERRRLWIRGLPYGALLMYFWLLIFIGFTNKINYDVAYNVAELAARYSLGFLGAGISSYAFLYLADKMSILAGENAGGTLFIASICFGLYAIFGGLIVGTVIGIPVVIFRSAIAVLMTVSVFDIFKLFRLK